MSMQMLCDYNNLKTRTFDRIYAYQIKTYYSHNKNNQHALRLILLFAVQKKDETKLNTNAISRT